MTLSFCVSALSDHRRVPQRPVYTVLGTEPRDLLARQALYQLCYLSNAYHPGFKGDLQGRKFPRKLGMGDKYLPACGRLGQEDQEFVASLQ